jgi:ribose transport system substrate-binding protein
MKLVKLFLASSLAIIIGTLAFADTVLLSMKGPGAGNPFWASVERGGREKAAELGVKIVVLAPPQESDIQSQINQVEDQITKGVTAIAIAVTDPNALAKVIESARSAGIPVVFIDTKESIKVLLSLAQTIKPVQKWLQILSVTGFPEVRMWLFFKE